MMSKRMGIATAWTYMSAVFSNGIKVAPSYKIETGNRIPVTTSKNGGRSGRRGKFKPRTRQYPIKK